MSKRSEVKKIEKIIKPYGYKIIYPKGKNGHRHIVNAEGRRLITFSSTGSSMWWRNVVDDLMRYGHIEKKRYFN